MGCCPYEITHPWDRSGRIMVDWLTVKQSETLLNTPDASTTKGLRDRAILALLLGCGLRRSECAALTFGHIQQRDGRGASWTWLESTVACGRFPCRPG
jgi:site-specific recombinase XerD